MFAYFRPRWLMSVSAVGALLLGACGSDTAPISGGAGSPAQGGAPGTPGGASGGTSPSAGAAGTAGASAQMSTGCGMPAEQALHTWVEQPKMQVKGVDRQWWVWLGSIA